MGTAGGRGRRLGAGWRSILHGDLRPRGRGWCSRSGRLSPPQDVPQQQLLLLASPGKTNQLARRGLGNLARSRSPRSMTTPSLGRLLFSSTSRRSVSSLSIATTIFWVALALVVSASRSPTQPGRCFLRASKPRSISSADERWSTSRLELAANRARSGFSFGPLVGVL